jgi:hypothetical protein
MYKIALAGKAGTGKNTAADLIAATVPFTTGFSLNAVSLAFADPIKEMVKVMFPHVEREHLFGDSKFRNEIIAGAKNAEGNPLTIRRALLDIGTSLGRGYNDNVWLENMDFRIKQNEAAKRKIILITDVRFRNEFNWLKQQGFFMIKVIRDNGSTINHISETGQDEIKDNEYDYVLNNNGSMADLEAIIKKEIISALSYV